MIHATADSDQSVMPDFVRQSAADSDQALMTLENWGAVTRKSETIISRAALGTGHTLEDAESNIPTWVIPQRDNGVPMNQ